MSKSSSKSALTASVISLALCVVMLIGTTFAWWSTSTSSAVNTVKSGNLTIDLIDSNSDSGATLVGKTLDFIDAETGAVIEDALWEPGCSYTVQDVFLKNTGSVDIKYKINVIGIAGDEGLAEVIDWTVNGESATEFEGTLASGETSDAIALAGSMKESAGNQYMNMTADGIAIAVYATQVNATEYEEVVALIKEYEDELPTVNPENGDATTLDTAYTFTPVAGAPEDKYASWNADYVVTFNQDVAPNAVCLAGQYDAWSEDWIAFYNSEAIAAGAEIRLLKDARDVAITYDECCNTVGEFNCGAASDVAGLTMTVELRLFERDASGAETGNYVTAGTYTYAF